MEDVNITQNRVNNNLKFVLITFISICIVLTSLLILNRINNNTSNPTDPSNNPPRADTPSKPSNNPPVIDTSVEHEIIGIETSMRKGKIIDIDLMVKSDNTVYENMPTRIKENGRPTSTAILKSNNDGDYWLKIGTGKSESKLGETIWSNSFELYYDYTGPVYKDVDYSDIKYEEVNLSVRIPHNPRMKSIQLWKGNELIYFRLLP